MTTTPTNPFTRFLHKLESRDSKISDEGHNSEDSTGVEYRKIGRLHCWEAKGSVRRKFLILKDHIKQYLEEHGDAVSAPVIWQVYMMGKSRQGAYPIVFFCSKEPDARKKIRKQIEDSNILANFPGFKTGDCTRPLEFDQLKPLAVAEASGPRLSIGQDIVCGNPTGRRVEVQQSGPGGVVRRKLVTVGAVFNWDGLLLFTTAAHAFFEHDGMVNFDSDGTEFEFSIGDDSVDAESDAPLGYSSEDNGVCDFQRQPEDERDGAVVVESYTHAKGPHSQLSEASAVLDRDDVVFSSSNGPHPGLDYCLVVLKDSHPAGGAAQPLCNYHIIHPRMRASATPRDAAVVAYTGSGNAKSGMISGTPTFMTLPGCRKIQELWTVRLDGNLADGDCGSIVVNEETGDLEGHMVAGCPGAGIAYIVPAHQMLQDIRRRFRSQLYIWNQFLNCGTRRPTTAINCKDACELAKDFREVLSEARREKLIQVHRSALAPGSESYKYQPRLRIHNIPISPKEPQGRRSLSFRDLLRTLSNTPSQWNCPELTDRALAQIPLATLHKQAEKEFGAFCVEANTYSPARPPAMGFQECAIRALLRWFKRCFFEWVDNPSCSLCGSKTTGLGLAAPQPDELSSGARIVEAYQCADQRCRNFERFPRYTDPLELLRTRKGRSGEWAQCFAMLCHAIGARARFVWSAEDHAWTEVYSEHQKRWIHVDAHAEAWDDPKLYCEGWGKKLSYCIAFSRDGAADVTRRYVRSQRFAGQRSRTSEAELLHMLGEICDSRRKDMPAEQRWCLRKEDEAEQRELQNVVLHQVTQELCKLDVAKASLACIGRPDTGEERTDTVKRWRLSDSVVRG